MNDVVKCIYDRRAIRKYKDLPVSESVTEQLLDAGRMAPSAMNGQPWKFYVVTDQSLIQTFDKSIAAAASNLFRMAHGIDFLKAENPIFHNAPLVIFITAPKDNEWASIDVGMCAQNIMLAAKSMGYDSCPVGLGKFIEKTPVYDQLGIPANEKIIISLIIGHGDEKPGLHPRKKDNVVHVHPQKKSIAY